MDQLKRLKEKWSTKPKHPTAPVVSASTSTTATEPANDNFTKIDAIQNAGKLFEVLESVSEASDLLSPLKAVCGVLKIVTDMALLLYKNGEDLQDLADKLEQQRKSIEQEINELSSPEFSRLRDIKGLVHPLEQYGSDLKSIYDTLAVIETRYKHPEGLQRFKTKLKAQSDQDKISDCTRRLDGSFQQLTNSVIKFMARQVVLIRDEMAVLHQNMAQKDAQDVLGKLTYVNARGNQHETCTEGTRMEMLDGIARWATNTDAEPMLALVDQAGTGKSTIAAHMTKKWEKEGTLLARFFFSKPSTVTANGLASTLAKDMAKSVPSLRPLVLAALKEHDDFGSCPLQQQLDWLVYTPLKSLNELRILVIDALDECSKADRAVLLNSILDFTTSFDAGSCPLKVLLTSRPEDDIVSRIYEPRYAKSIHRANFSLHSKENTSNENDIGIYITKVLSNYLTPEQRKLLTKRADGLFIWASTAQAFIASALDPTGRFEELMESDSSLNSLYDDVLSVAFESAGNEKEIVAKVLQAICVAREPLTTEMMDELLGLRSGIAQRVVIKLSSVLSDGSHGAAIYVLHPTFLEYLQSPLRDSPIVTIPAAEALMAKGCLKMLWSGLKYNICGLVQPATYRREIDFSSDEETDETDSSDWETDGIPPLDEKTDEIPPSDEETDEIPSSGEEVEDAHLEDDGNDDSEVGADHPNLERGPEDRKSQDIEIDPEQQLYKCTTPALHYAALHGLSHVATSLQAVEVIQDLRQFLESKLLNWIELMGWYHEILTVMGSVHDLKACIEAVVSSTELLSINDVQWCKDILGMVQPFQATINWSPMQVYSSALAFEPLTSNISHWYHPQFAGSIPRVVLGTRSTQNQSLVLTGHHRPVYAVAFSPDGRRLASASDDHTVLIWDPSTGAATAELVGHTRKVLAVAFSPDGRYLSSASVDETVRIWDAHTGAGVRGFTLTGHNGRVHLSTFSIDGQQLASGNQDGLVQVWDTGTGVAVCKLTGHTRSVCCVAFSPDGQQLASGSEDCTVRICDVRTGALVCTLSGHTDAVDSITFSPNGRQLASYSYDETVRMWDASTGAEVHILAVHTNCFSCVAFSPNGQQLVLGSSNDTVRIWDVLTGVEVQALSGHTGPISCVAFSPNGHQLASGSWDSIVRVWDVSTGGIVHRPTTHTTDITCCAFSPSGMQFAMGSWDGTVWIWDSRTGEPICSPLSHSDSITSMYYHEWTGALLLVVENWGRDLTVWNMSVTPPSLFSTRDPPARPTPSPSRFEFDPWSDGIFIPTAGISFYLPSSFPFNSDSYSSHEGRIAYGGRDGTVILIDCSHLLPNSAAN